MSFTKFVFVAIFLSLGWAEVQPGHAQTYTVLYSFTGGADGAFPRDLVRDSAGNLYGTTVEGGAFNEGTVFQVDHKGRFRVLYSFTGGDDGRSPSGLVFGPDGNLYGAASAGRSNLGTIFRLNKSGNLHILHTFTGAADGSYPSGNFIWDQAGNLYGTTSIGGVGGQGVVFKMDPTYTVTVLLAFSSWRYGQQPSAGLLMDGAGNLYGTAEFAGSFSCGLSGLGCGLVFELSTSGKEKLLHTFSHVRNGVEPATGLIRDGLGNFYGTTFFGGTGGCINLCGLVFKLDANGKETVLHRFTGGSDGAVPLGLVLDASGNLFGATVQGGAPGCEDYACGVVFKLDQSGKETVLHTFDGSSFGPEGNILMDSNGDIYGTTNFGGNSNDCEGEGCGVVFKITQ